MEKVPPAPLAEAGLTKFYLGQCIIELLQYYLGGQQRGRPSDGEADHQVASGLKSFILGSA